MLLQPPKVDLLQGLAAADKALFYQFGMGPTINVPFKTVHHAFEHHARQQPDAIAVEDFEERITYGELDRRANCLAATLRERGVTADSRLCYVTERSIPLVVGILAILKAGAAYVPLDGNIVSDSTLKTAWLGSETPLVLILKKFVHRLPNSQPIIYDDVICSSHNLEHCIKPYERASENHGCYVIYTSGMLIVYCFFIVPTISYLSIEQALLELLRASMSPMAMLPTVSSDLSSSLT